MITTRPGGGIDNFHRFYEFKINNLNNIDVTGFINKIIKDTEKRQRVIKIIEDPKTSNYVEFLRNPLLLSMFILAFESHPEIPNRKSAFYRNVFDTLYAIHDGITKNSFPREKRTRLQREDFEEILSKFSFVTLLRGQYSFTLESLTDFLNIVKKSMPYNYDTEDLIYDLRTSISILTLDGFYYSFPHRSMQEYFTALFVSKLPTVNKETAYSKLTKTFKESSSDTSSTFWSLCNELDQTYFTKYFLIPQLQEIFNFLQYKEEEELQDAFFEMHNTIIFKSVYTDIEIIRLEIVGLSHFSYMLLHFCKIHIDQELRNFPKSSNRFQEIVEAFERNVTNSNFIELHLEAGVELKNILLEERFYLILEEFRNDIFEKIQELNKDIVRHENDIDNLIDFPLT